MRFATALTQITHDPVTPFKNLAEILCPETVKEGLAKQLIETTPKFSFTLFDSGFYSLGLLYY